MNGTGHGTGDGSEGGGGRGEAGGLPRGACRKAAAFALLALLAFLALVSVLLFAGAQRRREEEAGPTPDPARRSAPAARER